MSRGAIVMSNLVYTSSLIYLASAEAGCLGEDGKVVDDCNKRVYGFAPAALMANIAVVSGVLSAFFMPLFGAIVDYTSHRWAVGVVATVLMIVIQIVQIGTVAKTWFAMLILQALAGFFYQVEVMAISAYLPDMARDVGQKTMTKCM
jgi:MFS family permease